MKVLVDSMVNCKFCGSTDQKVHVAKERMFGLGGEFTYSECLSCGSLQLETIPSDLSPYYASGYYSLVGLTHSSFFRRFLKSLRMKAFYKFGSEFLEPSFGYWLKKIKPKFSDRIADIGCGNGQLLYEFYASGFQNLHGFDPFIQKEHRISPSLTIWKKRIEESDLKFDFIMMHHSFEHMPDPLAILKVCFEKLKAGGKLLIRTPVSDAQLWKDEGVFWVQLDAPRHLVIPSTKGMEQVAGKVGFILDEIEFDSSEFQFWGTGLYKKGLPLDQKLIEKNFKKEEIDSFKENALRYNQEGKGDQVCFYFRKPD
ncbi:class I SAM-dependent methyltransferase [Algoriphagus sp. SE2]|uniref:class I SAM-dependent methyltransferase n=1 Tax=Algoriphagus sp. SE2 TaxID=3141536 RepID=UPI0031CD263F